MLLLKYSLSTASTAFTGNHFKAMERHLPSGIIHLPPDTGEHIGPLKRLKLLERKLCYSPGRSREKYLMHMKWPKPRLSIVSLNT